jgi:hypothetical protein
MGRLENMREGLHKARSGLIRALVKVSAGRIDDIIISGDFILVPERFIDKMEESLIGVPAEKGKILEHLKSFYKDNVFQSPGTYPEDFAEAIMKAVGEKNG